VGRNRALISPSATTAGTGPPPLASAVASVSCADPENVYLTADGAGRDGRFRY
jgi:hypothetical protein